MTTPARVSHSLLDPYLTTPLRGFYPLLSLPRRLPPESIVLMGHACAIAAAVALAFSIQLPWLGALAGLFVVAHHLCDVFDGQHARATNQCRHGGELLDHFLDPLSISYLVVAWAFAAGTPAWAIPGVLIVMATAVLTNLKAKLGAAFELPRLGPTELKAGLAILSFVAAIGAQIAPPVTQSVLQWLLIGVTLAAGLRLPIEIASAVNAVNKSDTEVDQTEWVNA